MVAQIECPYVGLRPFRATDQKFFFGRGRDIRVIASNLRARRLTVLYGASGVGKSSVLQAGVVPYLAEQGTAAIYFNSWQDAEFRTDLLRECQRVLRQSEGDLETLLAASDRQVVLMLDQFEEFLLYQSAGAPADAFVEFLARVTTHNALNVHVLVGIREEALALLDKRMSIRVANLFANTLVLGHLQQDEARLAIRKPLDVLSESGANKFTIEDELVEQLLLDVQTGRVESDDAAVGAGQERSAAARIETAFLQLVLKRLWDAEVAKRSTKLHADTLKEIGGATRIVQRHVEGVMTLLDAAQQEIAAKLFRYLVTPSRTKIAQRASDLFDYGEAAETEVRPILCTLSQGQEVRILRELTTPERYELFHDVLAQPVLDWVAHFNQERKARVLERERAEELERERQKAEQERQRADQEKQKAVQARQLAEGAQQLEAKARELAVTAKMRADEQAAYAKRSRAMSLGLVGLLMLSMAALGCAIWLWFETVETAEKLDHAYKQLDDAFEDAKRKSIEAKGREERLNQANDELNAKLIEIYADGAKSRGEQEKSKRLDEDARRLRLAVASAALNSTTANSSSGLTSQAARCAGTSALPFTITAELLRTAMPDSLRPALWIGPLTIAMTRCEISTRERAAMFLAQVAYESNQLNQTEESMKYSAEGLTRVWPSRFTSLAQAQAYAGKPVLLANFVYANRLGNGDVNSGDGWQYRGRGLIFITGRSNYQAFGAALRRPLVDNPDLVKEPSDAALTAAYYWASRGLNTTADANTEKAFVEVTRVINGGTASRRDRLPYWKRAKAALLIGDRPEETQPEPSPPRIKTQLELLVEEAERADSAQIVDPTTLQGVRSQMVALLQVEVPQQAWDRAVNARQVSRLVRRAVNPAIASTFRNVVTRLLTEHGARGLFLSGYEKDRKVLNALRARKTPGPNAEQVLGVLDPTVLGGTDLHVLFTDEGFYFRASALRTTGPKEGFIRYIEFPKLKFSRCRSYTVCFGSGTEFSLAGSPYEEPQLIALLDDLKSAVLLGLEQ